MAKKPTKTKTKAAAPDVPRDVATLSREEIASEARRIVRDVVSGVRDLGLDEKRARLTALLDGWRAKARREEEEAAHRVGARFIGSGPSFAFDVAEPPCNAGTVDWWAGIISGARRV